MTMRARTFVVPAGGLPVRSPDPLPPFDFGATLDGPAPSITDRLSDPAGEDLLAPVVMLAPRGRAWQTDETQAPLGVTNQHKVWLAFGDGLAGAYRTLWRAFAAAFPTLAEEPSLKDWETDYGLPDPCLGDAPSVEERRRAVRAALIKPEDASRRSLVGILRALGYAAEIDEWEGFECGGTGCGEAGCAGAEVNFTFFVKVQGAVLTWLECGAVGLGEDGLGTLTVDGVVCAVEHFRHAHTRAVYAPADGPAPAFDFSNPDNAQLLPLV